jgi:integrase
MTKGKGLTDAAIRKYTPGSKRRRIRDLGAQSLFLIVEPSGVKAFEMRFRRPSGRIGKMRIGRYSADREIADAPIIGQPLTLAAARELATKIHRERKLGADVVANHKAQKVREATAPLHQAGSFASTVHDYMVRHAIAKTRNWHETGRMLGADYDSDGSFEERKNGLLARWGDRPFAEIDRADIKAVITEARDSGVPGIGRRNKRASEARARALHTALSSLFSWAEEKDLIDASPLNGLKRPDSAIVRNRFLADDEIVAFWKACDKVGEPFSVIYRLLLLTGARLNEVAGMKWSELHDDGSWHLPSERTKNARPHVVPLSPAAQQLIAGVKRNNNPADLVFTTTGTSAVSGWSRSKRRLDKAMLAVCKGKTTPPWRIHDLRRTFVTGCIELGIAPHVIELAVNHVSGHRAGVAGVYNKSELILERKAALARWSDHVAALVAGTTDNVVVTLKRARKGR